MRAQLSSCGLDDAVMAEGKSNRGKDGPCKNRALRATTCEQEAAIQPCLGSVLH